jgi:hypothetical protein
VSTAASRWSVAATSASRSFQGRYFAQAEIVSGRRLSASQAALIRLINLVGRDVDVALIEDAFKHEPALTLNLLRVVNSVGHRGNRLSQPVTSLRHAITSSAGAICSAGCRCCCWHRAAASSDPARHRCCRWPRCADA